MNIQIFGTKKSFDTKKAERWFKQCAGGVEALINPKAKDEDLLALLKYIPADARMEKLLENQHVLMEPIVRNGKKATVGYKPEVWEGWE